MRGGPESGYDVPYPLTKEQKLTVPYENTKAFMIAFVLVKQEAITERTSSTVEKIPFGTSVVVSSIFSVGDVSSTLERLVGDCWPCY